VCGLRSEDGSFLARRNKTGTDDSADELYAKWSVEKKEQSESGEIPFCDALVQEKLANGA